MPDQTNIPDKRDNKGRFLVGNKGGPDNPKNQRAKVLKDLIQSTISDEDWQKIMDRLKAIALNGEEKNAIAAARELLDRAIGRPKQEVELSGDESSPIFVVDLRAAYVGHEAEDDAKDS